jgi:hypothetical protein
MFVDENILDGVAGACSWTRGPTTTFQWTQVDLRFLPADCTYFTRPQRTNACNQPRWSQFSVHCGQQMCASARCAVVGDEPSTTDSQMHIPDVQTLATARRNLPSALRESLQNISEVFSNANVEGGSVGSCQVCVHASVLHWIAGRASYVNCSMNDYCP